MRRQEDCLSRDISEKYHVSGFELFVSRLGRSHLYSNFKCKDVIPINSEGRELKRGSAIREQNPNLFPGLISCNHFWTS